MSQAYDDYLARLHEARTTPAPIIHNLIRDALGRRPRSLTRVIAGERSEVYEAALGDDTAVIIRITETSEQNFQGERWALERVSAQAVPVAPIIALRQIGNQTFCIQPKLPGQPLERASLDFWGMTSTVLRPLVVEAGVLLAKIHAVPTRGWGTIDGEGSGHDPDWQHFLHENVRGKQAYFALAQERALDRDLLVEAFALLEHDMPRFASPPPVLNHDDYGPKHFLVETDHIVGIIDFGEAKSHSYVNDFAQWQYWYGAKAPLEWLIEGYTTLRPLAADFQHQLRILTIERALSTLWYYAETGYDHGVVDTMNKLRGYI